MRTRWDHVAAGLLAVLALVPLGIAAVAAAYEVPQLGGEGWEAGYARSYLEILTIPTALGGLVAWLAARLLWRGRRAGRALGLLWFVLTLPVLVVISVGPAEPVRILVLWPFAAGTLAFGVLLGRGWREAGRPRGEAGPIGPVVKLDGGAGPTPAGRTGE